MVGAGQLSIRSLVDRSERLMRPQGRTSRMCGYPGWGRVLTTPGGIVATADEMDVDLDRDCWEGDSSPVIVD